MIVVGRAPLAPAVYPRLQRWPVHNITSLSFWSLNTFFTTPLGNNTYSGFVGSSITQHINCWSINPDISFCLWTVFYFVRGGEIFCFRTSIPFPVLSQSFSFPILAFYCFVLMVEVFCLWSWWFNGLLLLKNHV